MSRMSLVDSGTIQSSWDGSFRGECCTGLDGRLGCQESDCVNGPQTQLVDKMGVNARCKAVMVSGVLMLNMAFTAMAFLGKQIGLRLWEQWPSPRGCGTRCFPKTCVASDHLGAIAIGRHATRPCAGLLCDKAELVPRVLAWLLCSGCACTPADTALWP
jgi:hypothetical protein